MNKFFQRIVPWLLLIFFLVAGSSMVRTLWRARTGFFTVSEQRKETESLEQEVDLLEQKAIDATASFTLEKRVREELHLQREGEDVIKVQ